MSGCSSPVKGRGWCRAHYLRWYKTGDPLTIRPGRWDGYERPTCFAEGCERPAHALGLCTSHGKRLQRHGDVMAGRRPNITGTLQERLDALTDRRGPKECWPWLGKPMKNGYGAVYFNGVGLYAHRTAYELAVGPVPADLVIDHACHNRDPLCPGGSCAHRLCVNPAHLEPVTQGENTRRARARFLLDAET